MKIKFEKYALVKSGPKSYTIEIFETEPNLFESCIKKEYFDKLCMCGCSNYKKKWSCPPFAPLFNDFAKGKEKLFVLYLHIDLAQFTYIKNDYLKIKAANAILKSRADKFLRKISLSYGDYISTGSCRLCKPCKFKLELPCAHPDLMTYSFEAMGVDVNQLVNKCFEKPLLWYKSHNLPEYTSVVCGLLTNEMITINNLHDEYLGYITK